MKRTCAHPGCAATLYPRNGSGVCRAHNHGPACNCPRCNRGVAIPLEPSAELTVVEVPYPTSNSGVRGVSRVTLPVAPWDRL